MTDVTAEKQLIRELAENWAIFRDSADWENFKTVWLPSATIETLWYQGPWEGYLERSRAGWGRGMSSVHYQCGSRVEIVGDRGVCRSNMKVYGRGDLDGIEYDLDATAQFCDFVEKRGERWGLAHRCVVHVKDRIDAVESQAALPIDTALLARQPAHYRHLAYVHAIAGRVVKTDMPGLEGSAAHRLERQSRSWLDGGGAPRIVATELESRTSA